MLESQLENRLGVKVKSYELVQISFKLRRKVCVSIIKFHVLSRLAGSGHSRMLGLGFPTLREGEGRKAIKEAEGLHLGLLSSRDGQFMLVRFGLLSWVS
jgi:hypothetical protein